MDTRGNRTPTRRTAALAAAAAAVLAASGAVGADSAAGRSASGDATARQAEARRIATSVLGRDYKITLTALRSGEDPYAASVQLRAHTYDDGAWRESDRITVGERNSWFWYPLTGSRAVCAFSTAGTEPAPVAVSLVVTPSIGCSQTERFRLVDGEFRTG